MQTNGSDTKKDPSPAACDESPLGEWVELALEVPSGDQLGRMLRHSQPEDAAWRRIQAAERRVSALMGESSH